MPHKPASRGSARESQYELDVGFSTGQTAAVPVAAPRVPLQSRAVKTRGALLTAAAREFAARGYAGTTSKSIADRARVATGSFYQYFESKDVVLRELAAMRLGEIGQRTVALLERGESGPAPTRERLGAVVGLVMDLHREDPALHAVMTERRHADPQLEAIWGAGERALVERIAALLERWGAAADPLARAFVVFGLVEGSVHAHVLGHPVVPDDRFTTALVDALVCIVGPAANP